MRSRDRAAGQTFWRSADALLAALTLSALAYTALAVAAPEVFRVEPELSATEFTVTQFGLSPQHGRFGRTEGTIVLDPEDHTGSIDLVIDATSIDTGWGVRDAWLRSEHMFDVAHYPVLRFRSTQLVFEQMRLIGIAGLLTLRDVTRPVALKIERMQCGGEVSSRPHACGATAVSTIKRSEFGMSYALGLVGDDVALSFEVTASQVQP